MQNPIQSFLQKFASKHTFSPDTFPLLKSAVPFQTYYKTSYREAFLWLWPCFGLFSRINYFYHGGNRQSCLWTRRTSAPTQLLSSIWALCWTEDLCSALPAPGPGQQIPSFSGSSQKLRENLQLHTFSNTFLTNILAEWLTVFFHDNIS